MEGEPDQESVVNQCPECSSSIDVTSLAPYSKIECPHCGEMVRVRNTMALYEITGILGEGGMSKVFRAVDTHLRREVALKVLHPELSRDQALTAMFEREAKLTASVLHPNVVKVYTVGQEHGYFYIAMELVRATSLEEMIADRGGLSERDVLHIAHDVTSGLAAAQEESLIHRDIKPGNMLVTDEGTTKLVDFGLAVQQGGEDESEDLWATPFYVPPEKLEGARDTYLGDIYSLGATLYHALAGKPPFDANTSSLEDLKVIKRQPLDLKGQVAGLSKATTRLIEKMMAYDAVNRPQSYGDILNHIETIQRRQFGITRNSRRSRPDRRKIIVGAGIGCALLAVILAINVGREEEVTADDLGISTDDRVISVGENTNTERFLEGRELISEGRFARAEKIFTELVEEPRLSPSIRMWSLFFHGTARLFIGDESGARESFGRIDPTMAEEEGLADVGGLMKGSAAVLSRPLPVIAPTDHFAADSAEAIGLLAAGLKNWQHGFFEEGLQAMAAFEESRIPAGYEWMEALREQVKRFREDHRLLSDLPNPSRAAGDALEPQEEALQAALDKIKTRGAAPRMIRDRIDRIGRIREMEQAEAEARAAAAAAVAESEEDSQPAETAGPAEPSVVPPVPEEPVLTEEAREERSRIVGMLAEFRSESGHPDFDRALSRLKAYEPATASGESWRDNLVTAYTEAGHFIPTLAGLLSEHGYEGVIRRIEGVPLDAAITAATPSTLTVDLGFGPNEVAVDAFAPDWLLEAASEVMPSVSESNAESWRQYYFYSLAAGESEAAAEVGDAVAAVDPEFAAIRQNLRRLFASEPEA